MTSDIHDKGIDNQGQSDPLSNRGVEDQQGNRFEAVVATVVFLVAVGALVFFLTTIFRSIHDGGSEEIVVVEDDESSISSDEGMPLRAGPSLGTPIRGIVTRTNGAPASRARVELFSVSSPDMEIEAEAVTGKDGSFEIGTPFPGIFRIQASLGRAVDWLEPVSPGENIGLTLNPPATVTVKVENLADDKEATARLVRLYPSPLSDSEETACRRENNTFIFDGTMAGAYRLVIRTADSFVECPVDCLGEGPKSLSVEVPAPQKLEGVVRDGFGRPVPDALVSAFSSNTGFFVGEVATNEQGLFLFQAPKGRYCLDVTAPDFVPASVPMASPGAFQDVTLARGVLWHGSVVDPNGTAVKGARIRVVYSIAHLPGERIRDLVVAEDGSFAWRSAGGQGERFHVSAPGYGARCFEGVLPPFAPSEPEEKKLKPFELIPANTSLGGVVQNRHGGPVAGLRLCLVSAGLPRESPFYREWFTGTDGVGLFQFPEVASGEYRILIDGGGFARSSRPVFLSGDTIVNILAEVGTRISGTVRCIDKIPLPGVEVILTGGSREYTVLTDSDGRFAFLDVPPDSVMLRVRGGGRATLDSWDDGTLVLPEGGVLASRVTDGNGRPVRLFQAAPVYAGEKVGSARPIWVQADGGGRFRLSLPARPERILFRRNGFRDLLIPGEDLVRHGEAYHLPDNKAVILEWTGGS